MGPPLFVLDPDEKDAEGHHREGESLLQKKHKSAPLILHIF
jgi:hypothetical protein